MLMAKTMKKKWYDQTKELVGDYIDHTPVPTCLRNHAFIEEVKAGRGPIQMVTTEAFQDPHLEENWMGKFSRNDYWSSSCVGVTGY